MSEFDEEIEEESEEVKKNQSHKKQNDWVVTEEREGDRFKENENNWDVTEEQDEKETGFKGTKERYSTLELVEDIRTELIKIVPQEYLRGGRLTDKKLSDILGQVENHIKNAIKKGVKRNPQYLLAQDQLKEYEDRLKIQFGAKLKKIINYIEKYRNLNVLEKTHSYQIYKHHPDFNIEYFEKIDTKTKAYWFGFICADGYREKMEGGKIRIGIEINIKDEILIYRFAQEIGFNLEYKENRVRKLEYKGETREYEHVCIRFINKKIADDLKRLGVFGSKSERKELPLLDNHELELAFLLGFYDGDGIQGTTRIVSGNKKILEQIKKKNNLPYKISKHKYGGSWSMSLGSKLFNEMMSNYENSLERKRNTFEIRRYKVKESFEKKLTKEKLQNLVLKKSIVKIAAKYKVTHRNVTDLCKKWGIDTPPVGYWSKRKSNSSEN